MMVVQMAHSEMGETTAKIFDDLFRAESKPISLSVNISLHQR